MTEFEELYRRYAADVLRFALCLTGNRAEAEDITAESFARLFRARDGLRLPTVKAYLFVIARNLHRRGWRTRSRESVLEERMIDPAPAPDELTAGREELRCVLRGLQRLPELDRTALLMRAQEQMPYEQIAAALGLSVTAARVKVHRARVRLAQWRAEGER